MEIFMDTFKAPTSGQLIGAVVDRLGLRATDRLKSSTARAYFSGERISEGVRQEILDDVTNGLFDAGLIKESLDRSPLEIEVASVARFVDMTASKAPTTTQLLAGFVGAWASHWDALIGAFHAASPPIPRRPVSAIAVARLLTIDLALRTAALRSMLDLESLNASDDGHRGMLIRGLLHEYGLTRDKAADRCRVSSNSVDAWCDGRSEIGDENILDLAIALSRARGSANADDDEKALAARLRRHRAAWRLRTLLDELFGVDRRRDLEAAFIRIANRVRDGLSQSKLPPERRRLGEWMIVAQGIAFDSTRFLRRHASRPEQDQRWLNALATDDDVATLVAHARQVAAIPEVLAMGRDEGWLTGDDAAAAIEILADAPLHGVAPQREDAGRYAAVLATTPSQNAFNREAQGERALLAKDYPAAIFHFRRAVELEPTKAMWHFKLGAALWQGGDFAAGEAECRIATALDEGWDLPAIEIGVLRLNAGDASGAIDALVLARQRYAPSWHLLHHLGVAYMRRDRFEEAAAAFASALALDADNALTLECAAWMADELGDTRRAKALAKQAAFRGRRVVFRDRTHGPRPKR
jgi:Flp pilus assembly protein TadD